MPVVTIADEMGAGGPEIGILLAERLGCRFVDREMLAQAALKYGVVEDKLTRVDETKPSLFERFDVETRHYVTVLQSALLDEAEQDNVVINSRGGQVLLRGISHALRTRVIAPFDLRVKRTMKKLAGKVGETVDQRKTAEMVRRTVGFTGKIVWDATKPDGTPRKLMDSSRLLALGWKPQVNLEDGIRLAYEDFRKRFHGH